MCIPRQYIDHGDHNGRTLKKLDKVHTMPAPNTSLRLKSSKCLFEAPSVEYLGNVIDSAVLPSMKAKVKALAQAPAP